MNQQPADLIGQIAPGQSPRSAVRCPGIGDDRPGDRRVGWGQSTLATKDHNLFGIGALAQ
jgi:hypothetical protein